MNVSDLKKFAEQKGIELESQDQIAEEASNNITNKYKFTTEQIKENFDMLLYETEREAYQVYLRYEKLYGEKVFEAFVAELVSKGEIKDIRDVGKVLSGHFHTLDRFFLSLSQSRKSRAGKSFEHIHNALFKELNYKFDEQQVINGKPDFLMPSVERWRSNPIDCIIFTSKRTLRERWRQIVTEGTRGFRFFLATIDEKVSKAQLKEMLDNRIYLVTPDSIRKKFYPDAENVLSFTKFFKDHLDPAMERWARDGVI
ncbi:MAG: type II restriction endonuclease [Candidatus Woykebacteria bacterium]